MLSRSPFALLAALVVGAAAAAPAPLGPTDQASAVLAVSTAPAASRAAPDLPRLLASTSVLEAALRNPKAAELSCVKRAADPARWLSAHLKVSPAGAGKVRVAVGGCPPREAVALVSAVVAACQEQSFGPEGRRLQQQLALYRARKELIKQLMAQGAGRVNPLILGRYDEQIKLLEERVRAAQPLQVVQPPRASR